MGGNPKSSGVVIPRDAASRKPITNADKIYDMTEDMDTFATTEETKPDSPSMNGGGGLDLKWETLGISDKYYVVIPMP